MLGHPSSLLRECKIYEHVKLFETLTGKESMDMPTILSKSFLLTWATRRGGKGETAT